MRRTDYPHCIMLTARPLEHLLPNMDSLIKRLQSVQLHLRRASRPIQLHGTAEEKASLAVAVAELGALMAEDLLA